VGGGVLGGWGGGGGGWVWGWGVGVGGGGWGVGWWWGGGGGVGGGVGVGGGWGWGGALNGLSRWRRNAFHRIHRAPLPRARSKATLSLRGEYIPQYKSMHYN